MNIDLETVVVAIFVGDIEFEHVAVANALCVSYIPKTMWMSYSNANSLPAYLQV